MKNPTATDVTELMNKIPPVQSTAAEPMIDAILKIMKDKKLLPE